MKAINLYTGNHTYPRNIYHDRLWHLQHLHICYLKEFCRVTLISELQVSQADLAT